MFTTYSLIKSPHPSVLDDPAYVTHGSLLEVERWALRLDLRLASSADEAVAVYPAFHCELWNGTPLTIEQRRRPGWRSAH